MNDKKMITEITDEQIDDLLKYTKPYNEQNAANIKALALEKIKSKKVRKPFYRQILIAAAMILALSLGVGAYYISTLFFVPGVGIINSDISIHMMNEPIEIDSDIGKVMLEFATKMKKEDGKCEVLLYFTSKDQGFIEKIIMPPSNAEAEFLKRKEYLSPTTVINGKVYTFENTGSGGGNPYGGDMSGHFNALNNDFPDVKEFDLQFNNTTTHIILSELSDKEKIPYVSKEINGIRILAYKFEKNNKLISVGALNNNDLGEFYMGVPYISFDFVKGKWGVEIPVSNSDGSFKMLSNDSGTELTEIKNLGIYVDYMATPVPGNGGLKTMTTKPQLILPIPKDGETLKTDIKIPVGGTFYEVSEVRREGDKIYFKDNDITKELRGPDASFDAKAAAKNKKIYIGGMRPNFQPGTLKIDINDNSVTGFNPDDDFVCINIHSIQVFYFGDYSVDLTRK